VNPPPGLALGQRAEALLESARKELFDARPLGLAHHERASRVLPRGTTRARFWEPMPIYVEKARGAYLTDVDGRDYCDFNLGQGALVLGHAHAAVVAALEAQLEKGTHFGPPTHNRMELAELIVDSVPGADRVAFVNSGTEATMGALRIARKATGRSKVGKVEGGWHGANEFVLHSFMTLSGDAARPDANLDSIGVSSVATENVVVLPFNDERAFDRIREARDELACVIVEPVLGGGGCLPADPSYLQGLRTVCTEIGAVLILDEVITGYRLGPRGAAGRYGVTGDLTTLGKAAGGGQPIGVICGRGDLMDKTMWPDSGSPGDAVFAGGTFSGNPMTMAAGVAMVGELVHHAEHYERLEELGERLRIGLRRVVSDLGLAVFVTGVGSMVGVHFTQATPSNERDLVSSNHLAARLLRVYLELDGFVSRGMSFLSTAHTEEDVDRLVAAFERALHRLRAEGALER
jgi:glutamate-1-semialdehyde 2,1-aminomutase